MSGINRYDTPAQAEFINTHVPIPFEEMMKIGMLKQARVDKSQEDFDKINAAISSMKVAPADEERYNKMAEGFGKDVDDILNSEGMGSLAMTQRLNKMKNRMSTDPEFRVLSHNRQAYEQVIEERKKAQEAGALSQNTRGIDDVYRNLSQGGRGSEDGRMYNVPGWNKNVDTYAEIEKYVKNIQDDSLIRETPEGPYIVNRKTGGKTVNRLASVYGLRFNESKDEAGNVTLTAAPDNIDVFMNNLASKDWGQQYLRNAQARLGVPERTINKEVLQQAGQEAINEMTTAIKANVRTIDSVTISADPYFEYTWKKAIDDKKDILSWNTAVVDKGIEFDSTYKLKAGLQAADQLVEKANEDLTEFKSTLSSHPIRDNQGNIVGYEYRNAMNEDVTSEMRTRIAVRDNLVQKQQDIVDLQNESRQVAADKLGISSTEEPSDKIKRKSLRLSITEAMGVGSGTGLQAILAIGAAGQGDITNLALLPEEIRTKVKENYYKHLTELDPLTAATDKILKEAGKDRMITIGLADFPSKEDNARMEEGFIKFGTPDVSGEFGGTSIGLKNAQTGEPLTTKEYANISNSTKPLYKGWSQDPNTGEVEVYYRPYDKDGEQFVSDVKMSAPRGFINMLVKNNMTNEAELFVGNVLSNSSMGVDKKIKINTINPSDSTYDIEYKALTADERKYYTPGAMYRLKFRETSAATGENNKTVSDVYTREEAIALIIDHTQKVNTLLEKQKKQ